MSSDVVDSALLEGTSDNAATKNDRLCEKTMYRYRTKYSGNQ